MNARRRNRRKPQGTSLPARVMAWWRARQQQAPRGEDEGTVTPPRVILARIGATLAAAVCVGLVVVVAMSMDAYSSRTQQFKVRAFSLSGLQRITDKALIDATGLRVGSPLLGVSTREVEQRIAALPWVIRAQVRSEMPGTVHVDVSEHVPVAMVADKEIALVDAGGVVIKRLDPGVSHELPIITGLSLAQLRCPDTIDRKDPDARERAAACALARRTLQRMLTVARAWEQTSLGQRFALGELSWDPVLGISVMAARDGAEIRLGHRDRDDLPRLLAQVDRLLSRLEARGERLRYALMDDPTRPDQAVIDAVPSDRWSPLPAAPRAAGPSRPKPPMASPRRHHISHRKAGAGRPGRAGAPSAGRRR